MSNRRIRLTERLRQAKAEGTLRRREAVEDSIPYPGTVNQPERRFKRRDQYDNWEEVVNHPLPDMRHEWQDNPRDDIGFGVPKDGTAAPTVASVKVSAHKAVRLAILLLGEKTPESLIEEQARDFMHLGAEGLDRSLSRFSGTQNLYVAADDSEDKPAEEDKEDKEKKAAEEGKKEDKPAEEEKEDKEKKAAEEGKKEDKPAEEEKEDKEKKASAVRAEQSGSEETTHEIGESLTTAGLDIELSATVDEPESDKEADAMLASLFDDDNIPEELPEPGQGRRESSSKKGVRKLGGQPRVASTDAGSAGNLSDIWPSAPDISEVFN